MGSDEDEINVYKKYKPLVLRPVGNNLAISRSILNDEQSMNIDDFDPISFSPINFEDNIMEENAFINNDMNYNNENNLNIQSNNEENEFDIINDIHEDIEIVNSESNDIQNMDIDEKESDEKKSDEKEQSDSEEIIVRVAKTYSFRRKKSFFTYANLEKQCDRVGEELSDYHSCSKFLSQFRQSVNMDHINDYIFRFETEKTPHIHAIIFFDRERRKKASEFYVNELGPNIQAMSSQKNVFF